MAEAEEQEAWRYLAALTEAGPGPAMELKDEPELEDRDVDSDNSQGGPGKSAKQVRPHLPPSTSCTLPARLGRPSGLTLVCWLQGKRQLKGRFRCGGRSS